MAKTSTVKYTKKRLLNVDPIQARISDPAVTAIRYCNRSSIRIFLQVVLTINLQMLSFRFYCWKTSRRLHKHRDAHQQYPEWLARKAFLAILTNFPLWKWTWKPKDIRSPKPWQTSGSGRQASVWRNRDTRESKISKSTRLQWFQERSSAPTSKHCWELTTAHDKPPNRTWLC